MKKSIIFIPIAILLAGCGVGQNKETLVLKDHPGLKFGLTTQSFSDCMDISLTRLLELVDFADEKGFSYMEIYDPEASLTPDECQRLNKYAQSREIELSYAIGKGLLDEGFLEVFDRGLENAQQFTGPAIFSVPASGSELADHPEKAGWSSEELSKLIGVATQCGKLCAEKGIQFAVKNGFEPIDGEKEAYGLTDLFQLTGSVVGWQFDTGNFLGLANKRAQVEEVEEFMDRFSSRLISVNLKSVREGEILPVTGDSELPPSLVIDYLSEHSVPWIALEVQCLGELENGYANVERSLDYLRKNGLLE